MSSVEVSRRGDAQIDEDTNDKIQSSVVVRETTELVFNILSGTSDLDSAINALIEKVRRRYHLSMVAIFESTPDDSMVTPTFCSQSGSCKVEIENYAVPKEIFMNRFIEPDEQGVFYLKGEDSQVVQEYKGFAARGDEKFTANALLCCIIYDDGQPSGTVIFRSRQAVHEWSFDERCVLATLTKIIASYLLKARVNERAEALIDRLTNYDRITGRYKFDKFKEVVRETLDASSDDEDFMIFYSDITSFKSVNDMFGYEVGNNVLKMFSDMIAESPNFVCGCRDYSDNFISLCRRADKDKMLVQLKAVNQRFIDACAEMNSRLNVRVKTGIYPIVNKAQDVTAMIDNANVARKTAKSSSHEDAIIFDYALSNKLKRIQDIEASMFDALAGGEFKVFFQPKYDLASDTIVGSEALVRWMRPDGTMFYPDEFIPQFEKNGFIEKLDNYVLEYVCRKIRRELDAGMHVVPVSVNQSRYLLFDANYVSGVMSVIDRYQIPDGMLEIEITESMFFDKTSNLVSILSNLKRWTNVRISIDDFGSGYSSLNLLKDLPADVIKIDKEFLNESESSPNTKIIVGKTVELARELGFKVVCEGVETKNQANYLKSIHCDMAQGYLYSRPVSEEIYTQMLSDARKAL